MSYQYHLHQVDPNLKLSAAEGIYDTVQFICPDTHYNPMATLLFTSQTGAFKTLVSRGTYGKCFISSHVLSE